MVCPPLPSLIRTRLRLSVTVGALSSIPCPCYPFRMLSPAHIARYRDQGYLVVPDVLDAPTLATVRAEMARILEGARAVTTHTDMYDLEPGHRADDPRVRRVKTPHRFFPLFERLMRHPTLVAILGDLLGPAVRVAGPKTHPQTPRRRTAV